MRTVHVTDALSAYIDGALKEGERAQVERHLEVCEECRRHLTALQDVVTLVRSSEPICAPEGFRAQVRARVEQMKIRPEGTRRWPVIPLRWRVITAAAAVAVIGIVAVNLRTQDRVALREVGPPPAGQGATENQMKPGADRVKVEPPAAPDIAQRTAPARRPHMLRRVVLAALPVLALSALAWLVVRRRRWRRAW